jgi:lambda family phage tail tape measure protein
MADIASLSVKLGLVTVEWDNKVEGAKRQAVDLQRAFDRLGGGVKVLADHWRQFGGVLGAVSFATIIQQTFDFTDQITDLAKAFDITISETLAFRDALVSAGAKADGAEKIMATLFSKIDEGRQGNDAVVAQFEKLGITFSELKTLSPYDAIIRVAKGFEHLNDTFERTKAIKEFFGKQGIGLSIDDINTALAQGSQKYDKYAEGIKNVGDVSDNVKRSLENLKIALAGLMGQFSESGGVVSAEKFTQILKTLAAGGIAFGVLKIAAAFFELSRAILAARTAGALFNLTAGGASPIGIAIKLLAAGAAAIVYFKGDPTAGGKDSFADQLNASNEKDKGVFDTKTEGDPVKQSAEEEQNLTKAAKAKQAQVNLTRELTKIDIARAKIADDFLNKDDLSNQYKLLELNTTEKLLQINTKLAQELEGMDSEKSAGLIAQTKALASAERIRVTEEEYDKKRLLRLQHEHAVKMAQMESENEFLRTLNLQGADNDQQTAAQMADAEDTRIRARLELSNQYKETVRLADLENDRAKFGQTLLLQDQRSAELALERFDLEVKIADYKRQAMAKGETNPAVLQALENDLRRVGDEAINLKQKNIDAQRTFEYGWAQAYHSFIDDANNAAQTARDTFNIFTGNIGAAIDNFVRGGKSSFKDLARSIIADLIAIQMKAQAMRFLNAAFGMMSGGNPASSSQYSLDFTGVKLGGRASGGPVSADTPYVVGENGPEVFMPNKSGSIIPNHAMGSMGGTTNVTNNYINAIDVKSFEDRLLNSSSAIWAANQYANKSLAVNRGRA